MKDFIAIVIVAAIAFSASAVSNGCSGSKSRKVNVSMGEYYSEDEYDMLSNGRKRSYCSDLEGQRQSVQAVFDARTEEIKQTRQEIRQTRRLIIPIETRVRRLDSDIRSLSDRISTVKALPQTWTIRPGESLTSIAMLDQIYNDIDKWEAIWKANEDKILDPFYIFPDTVLVIPRDWPTE